MNSPANRGCRRIRKLHASINGRMKNNKLNGDSTAD